MCSLKAVAITAVLFVVFLAIDASQQVGGVHTCSSNGTCGVVTAVLTQQGALACQICNAICAACLGEGLGCNPDVDCTGSADCTQCSCNCGD